MEDLIASHLAKKEFSRQTEHQVVVFSYAPVFIAMQYGLHAHLHASSYSTAVERSIEKLSQY